ncbi:heat shock protein beta-1 [Parasteatoda tepidariorum]|uniref:heat shock protein beta-1 n=1 Tax=Parasteatoda tepidariorum TaxID=114398 RepID=UPI001C721500|nr:heat shock protein beta-1 [Parasteatoda tepidariorum]XP_042909102.1 heat shock protein beta-1 [Parasteatoda tepidariorum]
MAPERKVPIQKSDFHVLDDEFHSIRGRFESEMKKMEEEMARLKAKLADHDRGSFKSSASIHMSTSEESSSSTKSENHSGSWMDDLNSSPLVQNGNDGKNLKLRFDVSDYAPEEILVKTIDNKLKVSAKHEEKTPNKTVYREYNREFMLPVGTNPELIKSALSKDGILTIEAPVPAIDSFKERTIPIDKC